MTREQRQLHRSRVLAFLLAVLLGVAVCAALVVSCNAYADGFAPREGGERWLSVASAIVTGVLTALLAVWLDK